MIFGFTATRAGLTIPQQATIMWLARVFKMSEAHHGDCTGGDHQIGAYCGMILPPDKLIIHPPRNPYYRAFSTVAGNIVLPEKGYLERNRDIVAAAELMIGGPQQIHEHNKGGTWYTINHTREKQKPLAIAWPDGSFTLERILLPLDARGFNESNLNKRFVPFQRPG